MYAELPGSLQTFVADMHSLFAGGVYDTKYIADYHTRETATFLEYVFRKRLRQGVRDAAKGRPALSVAFVGVHGARVPLERYGGGVCVYVCLWGGGGGGQGGGFNKGRHATHY